MGGVSLFFVKFQHAIGLLRQLRNGVAEWGTPSGQFPMFKLGHARRSRATGCGAGRHFGLSPPTRFVTAPEVEASARTSRMAFARKLSPINGRPVTCRTYELEQNLWSSHDSLDGAGASDLHFWS